MKSYGGSAKEKGGAGLVGSAREDRVTHGLSSSDGVTVKKEPRERTRNNLDGVVDPLCITRYRRRVPPCVPHRRDSRASSRPLRERSRE